MINRHISNYIEREMNSFPSVTLFGPRQCGKTTIARSMYPDFSYANLEDMNTRRLAIEDPDEFFVRFPEPVIIDEIQRVPDLLSTVQVRIDKSHKTAQYLITGSQQIPLKSAVAQSLAGRTAVVNMLPLSISELKDSGIILDRDVQILTGGMPYLFVEKGRIPSDYYRSYISTYLERDVAGQNQVHDLTRFMRFMTLLAGRVGNLVNDSALASEVGVSSTTIGSWLSILEASHLVFMLKPWYNSRTSQVVKTPKIYFCDTGIAANLLGLETPAQVLRDPLLGNLFENLVVVEALKATLSSGSMNNLFFFRNSNGVEVDLVQKKENKLELYEIKSGKALDNDYLRNMRSFCNKYGECKSSVIYSGDGYPSFNGVSFYNFHDVYSLFQKKDEVFHLNF